ncbi:redoxin domain-containing protein [Algoriphagus pacificus]|uniref:Redoxin domain-containing protein n=1 Tax=Algoriphagus pacificus TaxID=2811234 RepID=A0ABS3CMN7_9BACT|nr:redoxin domain-containing protein [Algoriphagus pacificus]MBN7817736.1 redoxin domain-containing protein [Algoriphagus pacificus]
MIKENPSIPLEKVYNKYGVPEKVFYHPNPPANFGKRDPELKPKVGEPFPEFVFQTVEGDEIESKKLNGQWILVRFDFFTNMMNKEDYAMLVDAIDQIPKSSKITTILCSLDTKENVIKELGKSSKKIELVSDGQGFSAKYQIGKFPTTMLIAPDQTLYKFLEKSEYQEIGSIIE